MRHCQRPNGLLVHQESKDPVLTVRAGPRQLAFANLQKAHLSHGYDHEF